MYIIRHVVIDILTPEKTVHINLQIPKKKRVYQSAKNTEIVNFILDLSYGIFRNIHQTRISR